MRHYVTATCNNNNVYCNNIEIGGWFNVSIRGTFNGTLSLERCMNGQNNFGTVATYNNATEVYVFEPEGQVNYRLGFNNNGYTSGNATVRLSH